MLLVGLPREGEFKLTCFAEYEREMEPWREFAQLGGNAPYHGPVQQQTLEDLAGEVRGW